jgi:hypothetical protein
MADIVGANAPRNERPLVGQRKPCAAFERYDSC